VTAGLELGARLLRAWQVKIKIKIKIKIKSSGRGRPLYTGRQS
jgi:hypothetical protein